VVYKGEYSESEAGTPQGGIISPLLANFTLNGLEKTVKESIAPLTKSKSQRTSVKAKGGGYKSINYLVDMVRYADDFVILARSRRVIENYVKPAVEQFLLARGLTLSEEKTKIFLMKNNELHFLGYIFKHRDD